LSVGDVLEATVRTLRRHPGATIGSSALLVTAVSLLQLLLLWPVVQALASLPEPPVDETGVDRWWAALQAFPWQWALVGGTVSALLSAVLLVLLSGVMAVVVGQAVLGRPCSLPDAWRRAGPRLPALLVTALLVTLTTWSAVLALAVVALLAATVLPAPAVAALGVLGLLVALPVTLAVAVRLALASPAVMLESDAGRPLGPLRALRRSWSLVRGAWWRTFGVVLLGAVIASALSQVVAVPLQVLVGALPLSLGVAVVAGLAGVALGQALTQPILGVVLALVYVDRRIRTENLDDALARAAGLSP
jgi:hypothetical protein